MSAVSAVAALLGRQRSFRLLRDRLAVVAIVLAIMVGGTIGLRFDRVIAANRETQHFFQDILDGEFAESAKGLCGAARSWATENMLRQAWETESFESFSEAATHEPIFTWPGQSSTTARVRLRINDVDTIREVRVVNDGDENGDHWRVCPASAETLFGSTPRDDA